MRSRTLTAVALAALALFGLSACDSKIGVAATVNGHRISDNEVSSLVSNAGPDPSAVAAAQAQGGNVQPRTEALDQLVQVQLFENALAKNGGVPTAAQLAAERSKVTQLSKSALTQRLESLGFSPKAEELFVRNVELQYTLARRVKAAQTSDLLAAVRKAGMSVTISGRYGRWVPQSLSIDTKGSAGLPSFVTLEPSAKAAAGPVASQ